MQDYSSCCRAQFLVLCCGLVWSHYLVQIDLKLIPNCRDYNNALTCGTRAEFSSLILVVTSLWKQMQNKH
jgi:hypothetical protein